MAASRLLGHGLGKSIGFGNLIPGKLCGLVALPVRATYALSMEIITKLWIWDMVALSCGDRRLLE